MPRAPTFLRATDAPASRASLAMATFAHVSGCMLGAPDFESPCCLRLASRAVGAEDCCTSSGRQHQHALINHWSPRPRVLCVQPWTRAPSTTEAAALMPPAPLVITPATAPARRASLATASFAQASGGSMRAVPAELTYKGCDVCCCWLAGGSSQGTDALMKVNNTSIQTTLASNLPITNMSCAFSRGPLWQQQRRLQRECHVHQHS